MAAHPDTSPLDQHAPPVADQTTSTGLSSGKATASMIVGIIGLVLAVLFWPIGILVSIAGLVLGMMAKGDVRRRGATNGGMATAGIVCSAIGIGLSILFLAVGVAIFASNN